MEKQARILVVDDEKQIREVIKAYLEKEGFRVMTAEGGKEALARFDLFPPDVVLLDLMLPDIAGESVCRKIRAKSKAPVIMLTAKVDEESIVSGLTIGADDYITKPFSPRELTARVKAALRRSGFSGALGERIASGELTLDTGKCAAEIAGKKIPLTTNEYNLLKLFMTNPGRVFSREEIIEKIKSADFDGFDRAIDTHIKNLRQKIGDSGRHNDCTDARADGSSAIPTALAAATTTAFAAATTTAFAAATTTAFAAAKEQPAAGSRGSRLIETVYGMGYRFAGVIND